MKYFYLKKEDNDFSDILKDPILKKTAISKIKWANHIIIGFRDNIDNGVVSYFLLKFGEHVISPSDLINDHSPIPYVDYIPKKS